MILNADSKKYPTELLIHEVLPGRVLVGRDSNRVAVLVRVDPDFTTVGQKPVFIAVYLDNGTYLLMLSPAEVIREFLSLGPRDLCILAQATLNLRTLDRRTPNPFPPDAEFPG